MDERELTGLLRRQWGIDAQAVTAMTGGMNSQTWAVNGGTSRWVAKTVPEHDGLGFHAGLRAALIVDAGGIPAGAPVPTRAGALAVTASGERTAVLAWVDGRELDGSERDRELIGATLARAHRLLRTADFPAVPAFDWLDPDLPHLEVESWVRPSVASAFRAWKALRPNLRSWGFLHGDPAPEAFIESADQSWCGLIDWSSGFYGPLLFDIASAVMYVGPAGQDELLAAYLSAGDGSRAELERDLQTMLGIRWAVQASYFARRMTETSLFGVADDGQNQKGLDDARRFCESIRLDQPNRVGGKP